MMISEIEKVLMNDEEFKKHFITKHPPKYKKGWNINNKYLGITKDLDEVIRWIKDYMDFPLIEDNFTGKRYEHTERRDWREKLKKKYGEEVYRYLRDNKLRLNSSISGLVSVGRIITEDLSQFSRIKEKAERLIILQYYNPLEYHNKKINERIDFIKKLEDKSYDLLLELI
jgi:hypothetical protein